METDILETTLLFPDGRAMAAQPLIEACRHDPNPFVEYVMDVSQAPIHERIQDHYTVHDDCYVEQHRGIGKTVQTCAREAWDIGRDPEQIGKYIQVNQPEAAKSVDIIKQIIESPRYRHVFPNIRPDPMLWGKTAFRVQREGLQRDPTVEACGIFGHAGGRATKMVFDDVCDLENAVRKAGMRGQVKEAYRNTWLPQLTGDRKIVRRIGTCWHVSDITAEWRTECGDAGTLLRNPVVGWKSPDPGRFNKQELLAWRARLGVIGYARAFELKPVSSEVLVFEDDWLLASMYTPDQITDWQRDNSRVVAAVDWAYTEKKMTPTKGDPDWSVMLVAVLSADGHIFLTGMIRKREGFPKFKRRAIRYGVLQKISLCKAESGGPQIGIVDQFNEDAPFPVMGGFRSKDKITRAIGCQAFVESGRFHILGRRGAGGGMEPVPALRPLYDEMLAFPADEHDDCVDAALDLISEQIGSGALAETLDDAFGEDDDEERLSDWDTSQRDRPGDSMSGDLYDGAAQFADVFDDPDPRSFDP